MAVAAATLRGVSRMRIGPDDEEDAGDCVPVPVVEDDEEDDDDAEGDAGGVLDPPFEEEPVDRQRTCEERICGRKRIISENESFDG